MGEKNQDTKDINRLSPFLGSYPLEIRNTGLRPNWSSYWARVEVTPSADQWSSGPVEPHQYQLMRSRVDASLASCKSALSGGTTPGIRHIKFITGSEWIGEWDLATGMTGMGMYKMPHGVIYEGTMKSGLFEGVGVLKYPNGSFLEGLWYQGKLKYWQYGYADGLERDCQAWTYCTMPDRRFFSEIVEGFRPANTEQMAPDYPARDVPAGHYDAGQGFYNPKTRCVVDTITGEVLSIPTVEEAKWIMERCRSAEPTDTVGYRPDLYENWFKEHPPSGRKLSDQSETYGRDYGWENMSSADSDHLLVTESLLTQPYRSDFTCSHLIPSEQTLKVTSDSTQTNKEKEILSLLQQEGGKLHPMSTAYSSRRKHSLRERIVGEQGQEQVPNDTSFDGLLRKILVEIIESQKQVAKTSEDSERKTDTISNESNLFRLTQMIGAYADSAFRKKNTSSLQGSTAALEQFRILGKLLPSLSWTTAKSATYSFSPPGTPTSSDSQKFENRLSVSMDKKPKSEESMVLATDYESTELNN